MTHSYQTLASKAIDLAKKNGATGAICHISRSESTETKVEDGKLASFEAPREQSVQLTVFKGQKLATVSGSDLSDAGIQRLVERATAMADHTEENPYASLSVKSQWAQEQNLDVVDTKPLMDAGALKALAEQMEQRAAAIQGVTKATCYASTSYGESVTANSNGLMKVSEGTSTSLTAGILVGTGDDTFSAYYGSGKRHAEDLENWDFIVDEAAARALAMLGAAPLSKSRKMPVFFDRRVSSTLLGHLVSAIDGNAVFNKSTFLKDALGTEVFNPNITITDDPFVKRGLASRTSDSQGVAMQPRELVSAGVLNEWLLSLSSAKKLGLTSNGYANGTSNLTMENGFISKEKLLDVKEGLLVTGFMGRGANIVTGDYSRGAEGFLIQNGQIVRPVKGVTIGSTLGAMFKALSQADDLELRGSTNAPTCYVGEMMVSSPLDS